MAESKDCRCGLKNKSYCPECSKVRMVLCLKNGYDEMKYRGYNPAWYSFLKYNRYDVARIAEKMEYRVRNSTKFGPAAQVLLFYHNNDRRAPFKKVEL